MSKRIVILGAGESGAGSAVLAKKKGFDVFVSDMGAIKDKYKILLQEHGISYEEKQHTEALILNADEIIKSPGIPEKAQIVKHLREKGVKIISEIEFAGRYTQAKTICITGSNGKTTTTMLIYHILKKAGLNVGLAGNVGHSFALQVAEEKFDFFVIELSSFQLDDMYDFRADISILLNITPDHLDRYGYELKNYALSKMRVANNQGPEQFFIYCSDDEVTLNMMKEVNIKATCMPFSILTDEFQTAYVKDDLLNINLPNTHFDMSIYELALKGKHNLYNSMAAGIAARVIDIRKEVIRESLSDFQGVEHRLEKFIKVRGVEFINDSKATNVNSTWYALESISKPIVWIAGGVDKGNDYSSLNELVKQKVKALVCLGVDNAKLHYCFDEIIPMVEDANSMHEAVKKAYKMASKDCVVLLSPCCASFDLFQNYEDRGRQFKECVRNL